MDEMALHGDKTFLLSEEGTEVYYKYQMLKEGAQGQQYQRNSHEIESTSVFWLWKWGWRVSRNEINKKSVGTLTRRMKPNLKMNISDLNTWNDRFEMKENQLSHSKMRT